MSVDPITVAAEWLLTFAIHGTVVLAAVWAVTRLTRLSEPVEEALWRFALVGGLLTATLQMSVGGASFTAIALREAVPVAAVPLETAAPLVRPDAALAGVLPGVDAVGTSAGADVEVWSWNLPYVVVALALGLAVLGLARLGARRVALRRMLGDRRRVLPGSPAFESLDRLRVRAGYRRSVRLTVSGVLDAPVAFGVLRPEICVPRRALHELTDASRDAMLAHELAHVVRRDPLWLELAYTLRAIFPWQPLLAVATRRIRGLAEFRCDAAGARLVGAVEVADCLVEVAGWLVDGRGLATNEGLVGMTVHRDGLRARVERLIAPAGAPRRRVPPALLGCGLGAATVLLAAGLPGAGPRPVVEVRAAQPVADTAVPEPADPFVGLLAAVDVERLALAREVEALRVEVQRFLPDPELSALLDALDVRVRALDTRRDALAALIRSFRDAPASPALFPSNRR